MWTVHATRCFFCDDFFANKMLLKNFDDEDPIVVVDVFL